MKRHLNYAAREAQARADSIVSGRKQKATEKITHFLDKDDDFIKEPPTDVKGAKLRLTAYHRGKALRIAVEALSKCEVYAMRIPHPAIVAKEAIAEALEGKP
jgi:hypothetical protein